MPFQHDVLAIIASRRRTSTRSLRRFRKANRQADYRGTMVAMGFIKIWIIATR